MNKFFYSLLRSSFAIVALLLGFSVANAQYCATSYTNQCNGSGSTYIRSFSSSGGTTNITNNNTNCANTTTSYSDYTNMKVTQNAGASVTFTVAVPTSTSYLTKVAIFIDWNQNGVFEKPTEFYTFDQIMYSTISNPQTTSPIQVPVTAKHGITRMRVRAVSNGSNPPIASTDSCCGLINEGETEDYSFEVINPCLAPAVLSVANVDFESAEVSWSTRGNARMFEYMLVADPTFTPTTAGGYHYTDTNSRFLALKNLHCDTMYYFWLRSICDTSSVNWEYSPWTLDSFKTDPCCYEPQPTIENITGTSAVARWAPIASAYGYEYAISVQKDPPQNGTYTTYTSAFVQGLMSRQVYYLHVRSRCSPTPLSGWKTTIFQTGKSLSVNAINGSNIMDINAYPNPVKDQVMVSLTGTKVGSGRILVTDLTGKTLSVIPVLPSADNVSVDMSTLPAGIYVIKYIDDAYNKVIKVNKL